MSLFVEDSDTLVVERFSPAAGHWRGCFARAAMRAFREDDGEDFEMLYLDPGAAADAATRWAVEAELSRGGRDCSRG